MVESPEKGKEFLRRCDRCEFWEAAEGPEKGFGGCRNGANKTHAGDCSVAVLFPGDFGCRFFDYRPSSYPDYWGIVVDGVLEFLMEAVAGKYPGDKVVAKALKVASPTLRVKFKERYGQTMRGWHRARRMERAKALLLEGWPATEVCKMMGAESPGNFSASFRRFTGTTMWELQIEVASKGKHS